MCCNDGNKEMKKLILVLIILSLTITTLSSCEGIVTELGLKSSTATLVADYDYGFVNTDKAHILISGSTVFFDPNEYGVSNLVAGDKVILTYRGELYIQESYPSTIVTQGVKDLSVEIVKAQITEVILKKNDNGEYEARKIDTMSEITLPSNVKYIISKNMNFDELSQQHTGITLYASTVTTDGETTISAIYNFMPR